MPDIAVKNSSNSALKTSASALNAPPSESKIAGVQQSVDKRKPLLDARHRYLLEKLATIVDPKVADLEASLCVGNKIELLNEFFAENGPNKIFVFWQPHKVCIFVICLIGSITLLTFC